MQIYFIFFYKKETSKQTLLTKPQDQVCKSKTYKPRTILKQSLKKDGNKNLK